MRNFSSAEKLLFSISALLLVLSSYLLYDDSLLFRRGVSENLQQVGSLVRISNDVRRKTIEDFSWLPIRNQDVVYLRDSLFTGSSSSALLKLKNGTELRISANSLITLNQNGDELVLDLKFGDLSANLAANSKLSIKSGEEVSEVENTSSRNSTLELSKKPGSSSVRVNEGELLLTSKANQSSTKINARSEALSLRGTRAEQVELSYNLSEGTIIIEPQEASKVDLGWSVKAGNPSSFLVEVSTDPDFSNLVFKKETREQKIRTSGLANNKKYFWRVTSFDDRKVQNNEPVPSFFSISQIEVPQFASPTQNQQLTVEIKRNRVQAGTSLPILWTAKNLPQQTQYHLQISRDPDFTKVLVDYKTAQKETIIQKVPAGDYFARIRSEILELQKVSLWSEPLAFNVQFNVLQVDDLPPPLLLTETINYSPELTFDRRPASVDSPQVSWTSDFNYPLYKVQISTRNDFSTLTTEFTTRNKVTRWEKYQPGTYFVRIIGVIEEKLETAPSKTGRITVTLAAPQIAQIPKEEKIAEVPGTPAPEHEFEIKWTQIPIAGSYKLEMSRTEDFENPESVLTTENFAQFKVPEPGDYLFRVQPLDANGKPLTPASNRAPAAYTFYAPPVPPSLLEPFDKTSIFLQKEIEPFIWLEWKTTETFEYFEIEISASEDFSNPLIKKQLKESRFLLKEKIPLGTVYWRVRSVNSKEASFWSTPRSFSLISQKNETFIE